MATAIFGVASCGGGVEGRFWLRGVPILFALTEIRAGHAILPFKGKPGGRGKALAEFVIGALVMGFVLALLALVAYFGLAGLAAVLRPINRAMHRLFDRIEARYPALRRR